MPLIVCPDCGGKVSDSAAVCIHCGHPFKRGAAGRIHLDRTEVMPEKPVVIEATAKSWKAAQLLGAVLCCVGIVVSVAHQGTGVSAGGSALLLIGFALFILGRIGAWWHHR